MRKKGKSTRLYSIIFKRVFLVSILTVIIGLFIIASSAFSRLISEIGASRMDILRQITSLNQVIKSVSTSITDDVYCALDTAYAAHGDTPAFRETAANAIGEAQVTFNRYGVEAAIDVVFSGDNTRISSSQELREPLQQLLRSYWYINLTLGENDRNWNMRFLQSEESSSAVLSYGRVLRGEAGENICAIIVNTSQRMVFKNYEDSLRQNNLLYIVDENGIVVSHSNPALVGFALYHMNGGGYTTPNGFSVENRRGYPMLVTSCYDTQTQWTIVEELSLSSVLATYYDMFIFAGFVLLAAVAAALLLSYVTARTITRPLLLLTARMQQFHDEQLELMPVQRQYYEVQTLSQTFNTMIGRIQRLIAEIKTEESEKRSIEFDFLQAQMNPHFLHNTLFSIKSLVALGRTEQAANMLDAFIGLLKMPITAERKDHALHAEIEYVRHYMTIMEYRYGTSFPLCVFMEEGLENFRVPQLILQPLVENAIFHGISEKDGDGCIVITAARCGANVMLQVEDNGDGMTQEQQAQLWEPTRQHRSSLNGISLRNVRSRVQYVFGEDSHIMIDSKPGEGTTVTIVIVPREGELF